MQLPKPAFQTLLSSFKICLIFFFLSLSFFPLHGYEGKDQVEKILARVEKLTDPTLENYVMLQEFLLWADRPYLDAFAQLSISPPPPGVETWHKNCRSLKLIGAKNEPPVYEIHPINTSPYDKSRCIVLYSSYNEHSQKGIRRIVESLEKHHFTGHVIVRIGGYPNVPFGGLKLFHIPYAWKVAALMEAKNLGYKSAAWIDARTCPVARVDVVFNFAKHFGCFLLKDKASLADLLNQNQIQKSTLDSLEISRPEEVPYIRGDVIAVNMESLQGLAFLEDWMQETEKVSSSLSLIGEELILSALAHKHGLREYMPYSFMILPASEKKKKSGPIPYHIFFMKQDIPNEWIEDSRIR